MDKNKAEKNAGDAKLTMKTSGSFVLPSSHSTLGIASGMAQIGSANAKRPTFTTMSSADNKPDPSKNNKRSK